MKTFKRISIAWIAASLVTLGSPASADPAKAPEANSVDELVVLAEHVRVQDPARYAVMGPEVDRIVRKSRIATGGLVGLSIGAAMVGFAGQSVGSQQEQCKEDTPDAPREQADCMGRAVDSNLPIVYLGTGLAISGLLTYLIATPSKEEIREAARNALWTPSVKVDVSVDRNGNGVVAGVTGSF